MDRRKSWIADLEGWRPRGYRGSPAGRLPVDPDAAGSLTGSPFRRCIPVSDKAEAAGHIPYATRLLLPRFRLRYRAIAQSGKNFG